MSRTRKPPKKSCSERLRGVLYSNYMNEKPIGVTFESYYELKMEDIINHFYKKYE